MSVCQISILSEDDIERIHENTILVLEEVGVKVGSNKALEMLEHGGATVDPDIRTAYIEEHMVNDAVKSMPKEIRLCARNPAQDMQTPRKEYPYMATNGTAVYVKDYGTGEKRMSMGKDLMDFSVLSDAIDSIDYVWPIVTANDGPEGGHALNDFVISLKGTTKHFQGEALSEKEARDMARVGSAVVGGEDELAKRPILSAIQCPICPLEFERGSVEATMEFARAGIPVVSMSMALCGLTSPVTLASTIAIINAENLASFVISQLAKPGAPVVYSSESTIMNMKTGEIKYGTMEEVILAAAAGQMAKHYGAPSMVGGFGVGLYDETHGVSSSMAEIAFSAMTNLTLTDFGSGIGGLDQAKGASLEQVVIDSDIWESLRSIRREVAFDEDHFAVSLIEEIGPGGTFLKAPHTVQNMRNELFIPSQDKAELYDLYRAASDQKKVVEQAGQRVKKILSEHRPEPLDGDVEKAVDSIMAEYKR
ncbi:MAG: trimethylamine methyltransferase family protein [Methanobacteriota archaeon]|nr:MAG: trimethylamine methyltransferase family protein [Euryarchaeota archaeon]